MKISPINMPQISVEYVNKLRNICVTQYWQIPDICACKYIIHGEYFYEKFVGNKSLYFDCPWTVSHLIFTTFSPNLALLTGIYFDAICAQIWTVEPVKIGGNFITYFNINGD